MASGGTDPSTGAPQLGIQRESMRTPFTVLTIYWMNTVSCMHDANVLLTHCILAMYNLLYIWCRCTVNMLHYIISLSNFHKVILILCTICCTHAANVLQTPSVFCDLLIQTFSTVHCMSDVLQVCCKHVAYPPITCCTWCIVCCACAVEVLQSLF